MSGLTVALPTLAAELDASPAQSTWILVGYMVVTTALILVFGRLADIVGRRPLYLAGLVVFTVASGLCIVSPSPGWLIAARVLQGVGAASVVTNNTALLTDTFPRHLLGRALGWNATVAAVAQVIGPVIGGAATALIGWRGLFVVVLVIGMIATAASFAVIPRTSTSTADREPFDLTGAMLSTVLLTVVVLALTPGLTTSSWLPWLCGGVAIATAVVFVVVQVRRAHPLIDVQLFRTRGIALVLVACMLTGAATYAVPLIISLFEQAVDDTTPFVAGLLVTPVAVGTIVAAVAAGALVTRTAPRTLTAIGMTLNIIGLSGMTLTLSVNGVPLVVTSAFLFVVGCGVGMFMTPSTSALMLTVPVERRGIANGMRSTMQNVGNLLSTALVLAIVPTGIGAAASHDELGDYVNDLRTAGLMLTLLAVVGMVVCLAFPRRNVLAPSRGTPPESVTTIKESA
jgi:EmrB/QacA subfamily drug resistance transporter